MAEHEGSSPEIVARAETERISRDRVALTARLLLNPATLKPEQPVPTITAINLSERNLQENMRRADTVFLEGRKNYWGEGDLEEQKAAWAEQASERFANKINEIDESETEKWQTVYKAMGLEGEITKEKLLAVYEKYFTNPALESSVFTFVHDMVESFATEDGPDMLAIQRAMPAISWVATIFSEDAQKLIPSLIEAEVANVHPETRDELIKVANEIPLGETTTRANKLNDEEKRLLTLLSEATPQPKKVPTELPSPEREEVVPEKKYHVLSQETMRSLKEKATGITDADGHELTYAQLAEKLFDSSTGEPTNDSYNLDPTYRELLTKLQTELQKESSSVIATDRSTFVLSPVVISMIDKIAERANQEKKEYNFGIRGITEKKNDQDVMVGGMVVTSSNFTTAKETKSSVDLELYKEWSKKAEENTKIDTVLSEHPQARVGTEHDPAHLIQVHIHHTSLPEINFEEPSVTDTTEIERVFEGFNPPATIVWGFAVKMPDESLRLAFYESFKDKTTGEVVHRLMNVKPSSELEETTERDLPTPTPLFRDEELPQAA